MSNEPNKRRVANGDGTFSMVFADRVEMAIPYARRWPITVSLILNHLCGRTNADAWGGHPPKTVHVVNAFHVSYQQPNDAIIVELDIYPRPIDDLESVSFNSPTVRLPEFGELPMAPTDEQPKDRPQHFWDRPDKDKLMTAPFEPCPTPTAGALPVWEHGDIRAIFLDGPLAGLAIRIPPSHYWGREITVAADGSSILPTSQYTHRGTVKYTSLSFRPRNFPDGWQYADQRLVAIHNMSKRRVEALLDEYGFAGKPL